MIRVTNAKLLLLVLLCLTQPVNPVVGDEIYGTLLISVNRSIPRPARSGVRVLYQFGGNSIDALTDANGRYRLFVPNNSSGTLMIEFRRSEFTSTRESVTSFQKPVNYDLLLSLVNENGRLVPTLSLWQPWQQKQFLR